MKSVWTIILVAIIGFFGPAGCDSLGFGSGGDGGGNDSGGVEEDPTFSSGEGTAASSDTLDVDTRKEIFKELVQANWKATKEAREIAGEGEALRKYIFSDAHRQRVSELEDKVCKKYSISRTQANEILSEGSKKKWPRPEKTKKKQ